MYIFVYIVSHEEDDRGISLSLPHRQASTDFKMASNDTMKYQDMEGRVSSQMVQVYGENQRSQSGRASENENGENGIVQELMGNHSLSLPSSQNLIFDSTLEEEEESLREDIFPSLPFVGSRRRARLATLATSTLSSEPKAAAATVQAPKADVGTLEATLTAPTEGEVRAALGVAQPDEQWHEIAERVLTPEEERDARIIENRQFLDPKRFYKSSGTGRAQGELPNRVHFGTVVVGQHEFYSSRLTKRQRRSRIIDEVLADDRLVNYARNRKERLQVAKNSGKRVVDPAARKKRRRSDFS